MKVLTAYSCSLKQGDNYTLTPLQRFKTFSVSKKNPSTQDARTQENKQSEFLKRTIGNHKRLAMNKFEYISANDIRAESNTNKSPIYLIHSASIS